MSNTQCGHCHILIHYMNQCPEGENYRKRKQKQHASATDIDDEHPNKSIGDKFVYTFLL